jgi:alkanesulfonate monooxygenase SsuD/methylene tetrahydromethanopterin reductase-like flavin-dependent oxidoreductase (luciferase family)
MRVSVIILPIYSRRRTDETWSRAEDLGFHAAYTYDHLSWRSFRGGPWFAMVPTLAAAAYATRTIRLGTMVTNPNYRHPITLAKDLITLDELSDGRMTLGIGSGGTGFDATVLGDQPWTARERADRFGEFVPLLSRLLEDDVVSSHGHYYSALEACNIPGCVQRPRIPFYVAANGPRGLRLAAQYGQGWVTTDLDPGGQPIATAGAARTVMALRLEKLARACDSIGRDVSDLEKVLVHHPGPDEPLASVDAFVDWASAHADLGFTEVVVHWPVPESVFANDLTVFEAIAIDGASQLQ